MAVVQGEELSELLNQNINSISSDFESAEVPNHNHHSNTNGSVKAGSKLNTTPFNQQSHYYNRRQTSRRCLPFGFPSLRRCLFHAASLFHIFLALALLVTVPEYARTVVLVGSDAYSGVFLVTFLSTVVLVLLLCLRRFWDPTFTLLNFLPVRNLVRDALFFSLGLLGCAYARAGDHRVPCHLQDGFIFIAIPISIIYMSFKKSKGINNIQLLCYDGY